MPIDKEIEDLKKQIEEANKAESVEEQEEIIEDEQVVEDEPVKEESKPAEPVKEEPKAEEPDDGAFARMRREASANKKRADELEARLAALESKPKDTPEIEIEQTAPLNPLLNEMVTKYQMASAFDELAGLEEPLKKSLPDYEGVSTAYTHGIYESLRRLNPKLSAQQLTEMTKHTLIVKAAEYQREGHNPAEALYYEAKDLGFKAPVIEKQEEIKEPKRPDLDKVAANKARNSGMAAAAGQGQGGQMTKAAAADMPFSEWKKLPKAEKDRLMYG